MRGGANLSPSPAASDDPCHRSWPPLPARRRRARPQSPTAVAPAQHLSLAEQNGEPRRRCSPSAPQWPGPWQTPQFAILNHAAIDSGIPRESATQRLGISGPGGMLVLGLAVAAAGGFFAVGVRRMRARTSLALRASKDVCQTLPTACASAAAGQAADFQIRSRRLAPNLLKHLSP